MKIYKVVVIIDCVPETSYFLTWESASDFMKAVIRQEALLNKITVTPVFVEE